jgi:hypothetical protein
VDAAAAATAESRIVISGISLAIDDGRFPAKRIVGNRSPSKRIYSLTVIL